MAMFYKLIGLLVWKAAKFYVSNKLPTRKLIVGGTVALGVATLVAAGAKHNGE
jgi:hypothetical protein